MFISSVRCFFLNVVFMKYNLQIKNSAFPQPGKHRQYFTGFKMLKLN
jgi:hypothetical protein